VHPNPPGTQFLSKARTGQPELSRQKNNKAANMFKHKKFRQATLILLATAIILILPNLTRLIS
jgi:hypothetical protein